MGIKVTVVLLVGLAVASVHLAEAQQSKKVPQRQDHSLKKVKTVTVTGFLPLKGTKRGHFGTKPNSAGIRLCCQYN
jgi:hypothetical protein